MQTDGIELMRNSKDNVIMLNRKSALHQIIDPEGLFCCLALRTVPVAATIVTITNCATVITWRRKG